MKKVIKKIRSYYYLALNFLIFKKNNTVFPEKLIIKGITYLVNKGNINFGKNIMINSGYKFNPIGGQTFMSIIVKKGAYLEIGDNCGMSNSAIYCTDKIIIGKKVYVGGDCKIYDTDFHSVYLYDRMSTPETNVKSKAVEIKDGAFIGTGSIILKGVTIGQEAVIGAGSVITKDIPDFEVWAGNPARFIKKLNN